MTAVFEMWYDDRKPGERARAREQANRVQDRLARSGIAAEVEDDPPWLDSLGTYVVGPSGRFVVYVVEGDAGRARELAYSEE
jgi:hypothetical protein